MKKSKKPYFIKYGGPERVKAAKKTRKIFDEEWNIPRYHCNGILKCKTYLIPYVPFLYRSFFDVWKSLISNADSDTKVK